MDTTSDSVASGRRGDRWNARSILEMVASVLMIVAAVSIIWSTVLRPYFIQPAQQRGVRLPDEPMTLDGAATRGSNSARVGVVEYSDFQCPYCAAFVRNTLPALQSQYVESGKILFAFRNLPLTGIHQFAQGAAEAAECAGVQGHFWQMHDSLFADQKHLDRDGILSKAKTLSLNTAQFADCLSGEMAARVNEEVAVASKLGIASTPTFLIGNVRQDGRLEVRQILSGAKQIAEFSAVIDKLLNSGPDPRTR